MYMQRLCPTWRPCTPWTILLNWASQAHQLTQSGQKLNHCGGVKAHTKIPVKTKQRKSKHVSLQCPLHKWRFSKQFLKFRQPNGEKERSPLSQHPWFWYHGSKCTLRGRGSQTPLACTELKSIQQFSFPMKPLL